MRWEIYLLSHRSRWHEYEYSANCRTAGGLSPGRLGTQLILTVQSVVTGGVHFGRESQKVGPVDSPKLETALFRLA